VSGEGGNVLILASRSPRRAALLCELGIPFEVRPVEVDESAVAHLEPREAALHLARVKARAASRECPDRVVLGADTIVSLGNRIMGKPRDPDDARFMLESLSGRAHTVWTGICLRRDEDNLEVSGVVGTRVRFRDLTNEEIDAYVASGEPLDKAGAYAIQGGAGKFVAGLDGSFTNVIGLPTERLLELIEGHFPTLSSRST